MLKIPVYEIKIDINRRPYLDPIYYVSVDTDEYDLEYISEMGRMLDDAFDVSNLFDEFMYVIGADAQLNILGIFVADKGSSFHAELKTRETLMFALLSGADRLFLFHNHPTGGLQPSKADYLGSYSMMASAASVGIQMRSHAIIADNDVNVFFHRCEDDEDDEDEEEDDE